MEGIDGQKRKRQREERQEEKESGNEKEGADLFHDGVDLRVDVLGRVVCDVHLSAPTPSAFTLDAPSKQMMSHHALLRQQARDAAASYRRHGSTSGSSNDNAQLQASDVSLRVRGRRSITSVFPGTS